MVEPEPAPTYTTAEILDSLLFFQGDVKVWAAQTAALLGITIPDLRMMSTGRGDETFGQLAGKIARGENV